MKPQKFYALQENGDIIPITVGEPINITQEVVASLLKDCVRSDKRVFNIAELGDVDVSIPADGAYYIARITKLPLKAPYKIEDGILYPKFSSSGDPVLPIEWQVPDDLRLLFVVMVKNNVNTSYIQKGQHWLLAFDSEKRCYRLPLANIYSDGKICLGEIKLQYPSAKECVEACWQQIKNGQWNGDLDSNPDEAKALFRFKPLKEGFEQQPSLGDWKSLSKVISPGVLNFIQI